MFNNKFYGRASDSEEGVEESDLKPKLFWMDEANKSVGLTVIPGPEADDHVKSPTSDSEGSNGKLFELNFNSMEA